jgi:hypothetical protein
VGFWPEGLAGAVLSDFAPPSCFMLSPLVVEDGCLLCLCDLASAAKVEPTSPAIASAPTSSLVFIMRSSLPGWLMVVKHPATTGVPARFDTGHQRFVRQAFLYYVLYRQSRSDATSRRDKMRSRQACSPDVASCAAVDGFQPLEARLYDGDLFVDLPDRQTEVEAGSRFEVDGQPLAMHLKILQCPAVV